MKVLVCLVLVVFASIGSSQRQRCRHVSDCPCGSQCITWFPQRPCGVGNNWWCRCRKGCVVANIFIPAGTTNPNTYCNQCSCPDGPRSTGIPGCSRRAWCRLPEGVPLYPRNRQCPRRSRTPASSD